MRALVALLASAALGISCAHQAGPTPLPTRELAPLRQPEARLVLIGDAGVTTTQPSVLDEAAAWLRANEAPTAVVFLGDNFYPKRADERVAVVFGRQREVAPGGDAFFVPGNHDWHDRGFRLFNHFDRARLDALAERSGAAWKPKDGALGPEQIEFPHGRFRVIAIDSEQWRLLAVQCEKSDAACAKLRGAELRLGELLACRECPPAIVVAHHPLRTDGEHGGCEMSWLRRALKIGGQDVASTTYQAYVASLTRALAAYPPLLFAAGHDHSLQFLRDDALGAQVVSGAGAKRSPVCGAPDSAWSRNGFMTVDFARGAAPLLRVFAQADDGALQEVLRKPLAP